MFSPQQNGVDDNNQQAENGLGQESARRQQVLRFALIICLLFLFLDSGNQGTGRSSPGNSSKNDFVAEVPLGDQYSAHIDYILQEQPPGGTLPMNATGLYRGKWESSVQSGGGDVNGNTFKSSGSVLVQLVSVPVRGLPDVSFVYGLLHLYRDSSAGGKGTRGSATPFGGGSAPVKLEAGFPLQGVLISSQQKLVLFSTPYRSQRLYLRIASKHHYEVRSAPARPVENSTEPASEAPSEGRQLRTSKSATKATTAKATGQEILIPLMQGYEAGDDRVRRDTMAMGDYSTNTIDGDSEANTGLLQHQHLDLLDIQDMDMDMDQQLEWDPLNTVLSMLPLPLPLKNLNRHPSDQQHHSDVASARTTVSETNGDEDGGGDPKSEPRSESKSQSKLGSKGTGRISAQWQLQGYKHHPVSPSLPPPLPLALVTISVQHWAARLLRSMLGVQTAAPAGYQGRNQKDSAAATAAQLMEIRSQQPTPASQRRRTTATATAGAAANAVFDSNSATMQFNATEGIEAGALVSAWLKAMTASANANGVSREVRLSGLTKHGYLSLLLADEPLRPPKKPTLTPAPRNSSATASSTPTTPTSSSADRNSNRSTDRPGGLGLGYKLPDEDAEFLLSIALGESVLPSRFKALQSPAPPPSLRNPTLTVQYQDNSSTATATITGPTSTASSTSSPTTAQPGPSRLPQTGDCQYLVQLVASTTSAALAGEGSKDVAQPGFLRQPQKVGEGSVGTTRYTKALRLEPVKMVSGLVFSDGCGKNISLQATSFDLQLDVLKSKVDHYALAATFLCLSEIFLVVYQMKYSSTQALASRLSYLSIFAQSLLDANLCLMHLLLSFAFPSVFFASFIWISILKLLQFSVFHMRLIINIYQARFSQELAAEGWQGLRRRLIVLHARFYAAVLVVLLVSISFYTQPVVAVLAMFSFWVPQIAHSAYYGTKPAFHPVYLLGTSSARCFIPLYVLGCPHNFLSLLGVYMNPHYLAGMADSAAHSHAQAPGLSAASYSACWVLVLWMTAQVGVLLLQGSLGPRFFVPKQWLPSKYDYHRPIPAHLRALPASVATAIATTTSSSGGGFNGDTRAAVSSSSAGDLEMTGMRSRNSASLSPNGSYASRLQALLGFSRPEDSAGADRDEDGNGEGDQEDAETGRLLGERHQYPLSQQGGVSVAASATVAERNELECVICYNHITQGSFDYMITPCDHVFHEQCLTQWIAVKLECPVCRAVLPVVDED